MELSELQNVVSSFAAIRGSARLQPIGGKGDKVFPPTHMVDDRAKDLAARYAREERRIDGQVKKVVLLDSVQSQANRMEEALYVLWKQKKISLPVIEVALGFPDLPAVSSLTAPHRVADALLRDSLLGDTLFRYSDLGRSFTDASTHNAGPLFKVCPTACIFGIWDSTGPRGGLGFKLSRALTSEIIGVDTVYGVKTSSRIDPTNIAKKSATLYEALDPREGYTLDADAAKRDSKDKKKVVLFKKGEPADANHGNIPPTIDALGGGVTFEYAQQTVVFSLTGLRKLTCATPEETAAAQVTLAALGLVAILGGNDAGYDFRSRCHLIPEAGAALKLEYVLRDGSTKPFELDLGGAIALLESAASKLPKTISWPARGEALATLKPTPKLTTLITRTRELAAAGSADEAG